MAELDFTFVESNVSEDNGYDFFSGVLHGATEVIDVEDMVDQVLEKLGDDDCIKTITIIGHGAPGDISVGNGMKDWNPDRSIGVNNEANWGPQLDRLACRFCPDGDGVYLRGCNVGADADGATLLALVAKHLKCADVGAPVGAAFFPFTTGSDQWALPGDGPPPPPIKDDSLLNAIKEQAKAFKRWLKGFFCAGQRSCAGENAECLRTYRTSQIIGARYLERSIGTPFAVELIPKQAERLPAALVRLFVESLESNPPAYLPGYGYAFQGYLQLRIEDITGVRRWLPPGVILGGTMGYSALGGDTSLVYGLSLHFREHFETWRASLNAEGASD